MPWTAKESTSHSKKANTKKKKSKWASVANKVLKESGDEGKAIRIANSAVDGRFWDGDSFLGDQFDEYKQRVLDGKKKKVSRYDPAGRSEGYFEEEDSAKSLVDINPVIASCATGTTDSTVEDVGWTEEAREAARAARQRGGQESLGVKAAQRTAVGWLLAGPLGAAIGLATARATTRGQPEEWNHEGWSGTVKPPADFEPPKYPGPEHEALEAHEEAEREAASHERWSGIEPPANFKVPKRGKGDSASTIRMYDKIEIDDAAKVRVLANGYMAAMPRIARTGIQVYCGDECGRSDMERVRVWRPEAEVFHKDATHSYTHLPVTLDHPSVLVDSSNWKKYAVGETGDEVLRDGNAVRVPMMLRDVDAIKAFKEGTNQLSVGYDCDMEWVDGVTDDGEQYDAIQHGIRANHLAVVAAARGGSTLTIGDSIEDEQVLKGANTMNLKTILVDGLEVQVLDSAATVIQRTISSLEGKYHNLHDKFKKKEEEEEDRDEEDEKKDAAIKAKDEAIKAKDKELETKSGEIAALKSQLVDAQNKFSPAAIDSAARERAGVINKAQSIMAGKLKTDGLTVPEIRRAVVDARITTCKDWSDDRVEGAFDAMQTNSFSDRNYKPRGGMIEDAVAVFGRPGAGYNTPAELRDKAYNDYDQSVSDAWRGKGAQQ